jgi:hypothetical protein
VDVAKMEAEESAFAKFRRENNPNQSPVRDLSAMGGGGGLFGDDDFVVKSVLLNPSAFDSNAPGKQLRLTLAYADKLQICKPLADYLLFSSSPKITLLTRMMEPVDYGMFKPKRGLLPGTNLFTVF